MWRPRRASGTRVVENWEHGNEPENAGWGGPETSGFNNQADGTLEGSQNAVNGTAGSAMSTASEQTSQGNEYRERVYFPSSTGGTYQYFAIHGQTNDSGSTTNNSYQILSNHGAGSFTMWETDGSGSRTQLGSTVSFTFADDTEYQVGIRHRSDGDVAGFLYDASGTQQASIGPATPNQQVGPGAVWVYHDAAGVLFDDVREIP